MPWVKLDDDWYDDPDLIAAGPAAMLLWPLLISWSARNLQDGKIPAGQIRRLVDWTALGVDPEQAVAPLVINGRLQEIAGGYLIVNYLKYQPSRERVLADRDAAKARAQKSRERALHVREPCADGAAPPVPVPVPNKSSSSSSVTETGLPADLWMKIAEKQASLTSSQIANPAAWKRKAATNAQADLTERAQGLIARYDLTPTQLVDALVQPTNPPWLNHHLRRDAS